MNKVKQMSLEPNTYSRMSDLLADNDIFNTISRPMLNTYFQ